MSFLLFKLTNDEVPANEKEVLRYLGYRGSYTVDDVTMNMVRSCIDDMQKIIAPAAVYEEFDLNIDGESISFADVTLVSHDLSKNLAGCRKVVLLAATIGSAVDAMIRREQLLDSARAAVLQSCGAMFVEEFVDILNDKITAQAEGKTHPRYSPGYGDVKLDTQRDFFRLLPCSRAGLTLMDSLIMAPEKSVTAFIGIE